MSITISTHSAGSRARRADSMNSIAGASRSADIREAPQKIVAHGQCAARSGERAFRDSAAISRLMRWEVRLVPTPKQGKGYSPRGSVTRQLVHYPEQRL